MVLYTMLMFIKPILYFSLFNSTTSVNTEEDRALKQSEVNLLMDEVDQAQTRLLSLEREKVTRYFCVDA